MSVDKVLLATPRGFCAGVEKAIKALAWMVKIFPPPVYCYHEIVHNHYVVEIFKKNGVVFIDDVNLVPAFSPLMLSAHGTAPDVEESARTDHRVVINAVCPLVTKVHHEVKIRSKKGFNIIYVGHSGHEEAVGTMAVAPESVYLVETPQDLDNIPISDSSPTALLAQTTLSQDEWKDILDKAIITHPDLWMPNRGDLCFATTNRQDALAEISHMAETVIVVGSANSSNTVALTKVAKARGAKNVIRVNSDSEIPDDLTGIVGVTAGASAPDELVFKVIERLNPKNGYEEVGNVIEDEYFPPPPELRELIKGMTKALEIGVQFRKTKDNALDSDRELTASDSLALLRA
jgi:4-hydroxy-3-methylbut-2-enyl diphosphate reductase